MDEFDYIVVGAGSAGGTVAARLSEDPNSTVCVLEAGGRDWNPYIHIPAGFMKTLVDPSVNWLYESEPSEGTAGRRIHAPRGKTLGGSSSINGNVYSRGQRMDFDGWAQQGNRGWGYADVLPYFKRSERRVGEGDETFRGRDGSLIITDIHYQMTSSRARSTTASLSTKTITAPPKKASATHNAPSIRAGGSVRPVRSCAPPLSAPTSRYARRLT
jgi:choline dehydrogenase